MLYVGVEQAAGHPLHHLRQRGERGAGSGIGRTGNRSIMIDDSATRPIINHIAMGRNSVHPSGNRQPFPSSTRT
jgi:hypothetical protein